ncbi:glycoside hydrolase domain-containing protein [Curtobacterium citreum]|uniref:glycoside hydrolase domain-containing protein n=1 Tax=Curtobacterium citreum TaxID=2036 RepID=UPI0007362BF7|nr:glycoside hydrolase domain-containing protein [Curtobacterium citreum]KTR24865.1 hypothetical protein NS330_02200 [Curtobacterium citreum]
MDEQVLRAQQWMNANYRSVSGYQTVAEDGISGWGTMYGLTRALQHELGITSLSNNFGDGTAAAFTSKIGQLTAKTTNKRLVGILQCAMWCKGQLAGPDFGTWNSVLTGSISTVRERLGLASGASVDVKLMRSLLTMDAYTRVAGGRESVRSAQQWLNGRYSSHSSYRLVPCDGIYSRDVQFGFMLGIQFEMDMADGVANGNFGPGTQSGLKSKADIGAGSADGTKKWVSLFQIALVFNGYDVQRSGTFDTKTVSTTRTFQAFLLISSTGRGDFDTWAALLVSTGNPDRAVTGADTSTPVSQERAQDLRASGYSVIGRYLTVAGKGIEPGELDRLFAVGFSVIPIMQNYNNAAEYFTYDIGYTQGYQAAMRARQLGFAANTVIFFPVDYDAFAAEVGGILKAYFSGVAAGLGLSVTVPYKIGVYATRYVADQVFRNGWAEAIWVSGMSTGYSGNLGYPMPQNWSYNQIQEVHAKNIDRNAVSSAARPVSADQVDLPPSQSPALYDSQFDITRMQVLAERERQAWTALVGEEFPSYHVLSYLMDGYYDIAADPTAVAFHAYLPRPQDANSLTAPAHLSVRQAIDVAFPDRHAVLQNLVGDGAHMAATAQGVLYWGDHAGSSQIGFGDLGGWTLDLATFWRKFRESGSPSISEFAREHLAQPSDPNKFPQEDLYADADGWLLGRLAREGVSVDAAYRRVYRDLPTEQARLRAFLVGRFGSRQNLESTIRDMFSSSLTANGISVRTFTLTAKWPTPEELTTFASTVSEIIFKKAWP